MTNKNIFFILSTARCRSTWFSNLFTYKDSFCYNEEGRYMSSLEDVYERIEKRPEKNVGFSDPEMLHYINDIHQMFPNAKYLFLERDLRECLESLYKVSGVPGPILEKKFMLWENNINYLKENIKHHKINFYDMDDREVIKDGWNYLLPNVEFDDGRYDLLTSMLIKVTLADKPRLPLQDCISPYFKFDHKIFA